MSAALQARALSNFFSAHRAGQTPCSVDKAVPRGVSSPLEVVMLKNTSAACGHGTCRRCRRERRRLRESRASHSRMV